MTTFDRGRSPRMRGSRSSGKVVDVRRRSIPAHAGKPRSASAAGAYPWVDPRACGEAVPPVSAKDRLMGRSPRMRGSQPRRQRKRLRGGSIPAHAGKPPARFPQRPASRVDPRACGEAIWETRKVVVMAGRSPRMRGSPTATCGIIPSKRSIPAHAGKPLTPRVKRWNGKVDPRACGEAPSRMYCEAPLRGRSPRMRGSRSLVASWPYLLRSIPAHAGKPGRRWRW